MRYIISEKLQKLLNAGSSAPSPPPHLTLKITGYATVRSYNILKVLVSEVYRYQTKLNCDKPREYFLLLYTTNWMCVHC